MDAADVMKKNIHAPCEYINPESKKNDLSYPAVNCSQNCENCGWNPAEAARRMETGQMVKTRERTNSETGQVERYPYDVEHLVFPRKGEKNESIA